ncbi:YfhO family protein [Schinkia sp. CFF1]
MIRNKHFLLICGSLVLSIVAHAFFIYQTLHGTYMVGPNDGLSQMVPFRKMLYDQFSSGNFFYSFQYGLGGGTYQLAYYYADNIFYFFVFGIVFILDKLSFIPTPDVLFWAQASVYISIVRLTIILILTTYVFRYMKIKMGYAFIGAFFYGGSIIYFRHATYWEFFADAFLWLPLFVLGIEKIIREQKPITLLAAVAISMFDNFYFAYIHFIFMGIYIILRWIIPLTDHEKTRIKQLVFSVMLGAGISAVSFIPAVYGFLHNYRPTYEDTIHLFSFHDNVLLGSNTLLLPLIVVMFLFVKKYYQIPLFRLFAILTILFTFFHYSPRMASVFNGFSAPQFRFEYIASFAVGGAISVGLMNLSKITKKDVGKSSIYTFFTFIIFYMIDSKMKEIKFEEIILSILLLLLYFLVIKNKKNTMILTSSILAVNIATLTIGQYEIFSKGNVKASTYEYMTGDTYASAEQRKLIEAIKSHDKAEMSRIDWMVEDRNNTPIVEDFNGVSVYSSILNQNLLFFYYHHVNIDMKRESVSRYNSFGDRANLYSLLRGKYIMYKKGTEKNLPYGFKRYMESNHYVVYRNEHVLPFVRTTKTIYNEETLHQFPVIDREHAMLNGVIMKDPEGPTDEPSRSEDLFSKANIQPVMGTYKNGQLQVSGDMGGVDLKLNNLSTNIKDLYLSFYLKNNSKDAPLFPLYVNEFETTRKSQKSIYRTKINQITVRIPRKDTISIRVPKGSYTLKDFHLFSEDYTLLKKKVIEKTNDATAKIEKNKVHVHLQNNNNDTYMILPLPYEKGWECKVNGRKQKVIEVNYAFIGIPIEKGENNIELSFYPPYFIETLLISCISLLISFVWIKKGKYIQ